MDAKTEEVANERHALMLAGDLVLIFATKDEAKLLPSMLLLDNHASIMDDFYHTGLLIGRYSIKMEINLSGLDSLFIVNVINTYTLQKFGI